MIGFVAQGNDEAYGLLFVAQEFKNHGLKIKFYDAEMNDVVHQIAYDKPSHVCFSPMTVFLEQALKIAKELRFAYNPEIVFGGHHVTACQRLDSTVDKIVVGPVSGTIKRILYGKERIIKSEPKSIDTLGQPARSEYYRDIPRMRGRYRKVMLSVLGCPWNCTYCASSVCNKRNMGQFGKYYLVHRDLDDILREAMTIKDFYPTKEIEWTDDDMFFGSEDWLLEFIDCWAQGIKLPMYISTTSVNVLRVSDKLLERFLPWVSAIGLGVQCIRPLSLKLMGRAWDNEDKIKQAYERLRIYGFRVNLQCIIGLPIKDPVEDAIDTILGMIRIGKGSIASCYPLQIYPGTMMEKYCLHKGFEFDSTGDTNTGGTGIKFDILTAKRIRNLCKLATPIIKYGIEERWIRALMDVDFDDTTSRTLSLARYYECVKDRLPDKADEIFKDILAGMNIRY